jgi:TonB family protein
MKPRLPVWVLLSVAVHVGLLAGVLTLAGAVATPAMFFIDLVHGLAAVDEEVDESVPAARGRRDGGTQMRGGAPARATRPIAVEGPASPARRAPALEPHARATGPGPAPLSRAPLPPVTPRSEPARLPVEVPSPLPAPAPVAPEPAPMAQPSRPAPPAEPPALAAEQSAAVSELSPPAAPASPSPRTTEPTAPSALPGSSGPGVTASGPLDATPARGGGASAPPGRRPAGRADGNDGGRTGADRGVGPGGELARAVPGERDGALAEYGAYYELVRRRIHERLTYPSSARHRGLSGTVQIDVEIAASGTVGHVSLAASSAHRVLDEAALDAARGLRRVPFPPDVRPRPLRVRLPVVFELR